METWDAEIAPDLPDLTGLPLADVAEADEGEETAWRVMPADRSPLLVAGFDSMI